MYDKKDEISEIENLVRNRRIRLAQDKLIKLLKLRTYDEALLLQACDWYRRLGLFREGFLLLSPQEPFQRQISTETPEGKRLFWAARFLNLMGATEFARALLRSLRCESALAHRIAGTIHLASFDFAGAVAHFQRMEKTETDPKAYASRLGRLGFADAWAGLGETDRAFELAKKVQTESSEPLMQGISLAAQGEYRARAGDFASALAILNEAQNHFPAEDTSPDQGLLKKWRGYANGMLGNQDQARADFTEARAILFRPALRAEVGFDLLRLEVKSGLKPSSELERVFHYPGLAEGFRKVFPEGLSASLELGPKNAVLEIDLALDEYAHRGVRYFGIPKEVRVIGELLIAGEWGIHADRMKSRLWPDEVYSFAQLESRLHQLLRRARRQFDATIVSEKGSVKLISIEGGVRVRIGLGTRPEFLIEAREFSREDLQSRYGIEKSSACVLLAQWRENGWIEPVGAGKAIRYRRIG